MDISIIPDWIVSIAISAAFAMIYYAVFTFIFRKKISWISLAIGIFGVGTGAYFIETFFYYDIFYSAVISLLFVAPIVEESLKTAGIFYGRKIENGLAVGLGFALAENTVYFVKFSIIYHFTILILLYTIFRGIMDPSIHSLTASLDSFFYKEKWYYKLAPVGSILIHMGYNFAAIVIPYEFYSQQFLLYSIIAVALIFGLSMFLLKTKNAQYYEEKISLKDLGYISKNDIENIVIENNAKKEINENSDPKANTKNEEIIIDKRSLQSLAESINAINQKHGFETVIKHLNIKYEPYEKTMWIRHAEYSENDRNQIYIEIGWLGAVSLVLLSLMIIYVIWFLFFS